MNKPPAFQFYADDFLSGTADMTAEEVGVYIRLLCHSWNKNGIEDNERLALLAGQCQASSLAHAKSKFRLIDGRLKNDRQELERRKQAEFRSRQAENGKKRWPGIARPDAKPDAAAKPPSPSPSPIIDTQYIAPEVELPPRFPKTEQEAKAAAGTVGCSEELAVEVWNKAMGRHGRDAKDIPIRSWVHYLATEAKYQRQREAARKPSQPESKQIRETIFVKDL